MTAPRRDETTMLSDAEILTIVRDVKNLGGLYDDDFVRRNHRNSIAFVRAAESRVVSALSARGGEPTEAEKLEALDRVFPAGVGGNTLTWQETLRALPINAGILEAGIALGRRHAVSPEALADAKREGFRRGWFGWRDGQVGETVDEAIARVYPLPVPPAPKGVTTFTEICALCHGPLTGMYTVNSDGSRHTKLDDCIRALTSRLALAEAPDA